MKRLLVTLSEGRMAWKLAVAFVALSALAFTLYLSVDSPFSELSAIQLLENRLAHESLHLLAFPGSETPLSIRLSKSDLNRYQVYAKNTSADSYLLIGKDGTASLDRTDLGTVRARVHVHLNGGRMSLFIDGKRVPVDLDGFTAFYLTAQLATPKDAVRKYTEIDMADSFMRTDLFADRNWSSDAGQWALNKHGAGLIEERHWLTESSIARAVNPFSVRGSGNGLLSYGHADHVNYRVEARFYFGMPQTSKVRDIKTLPGSFALVQGYCDGVQIRFGWDSAVKRFALARKTREGAWEVVERWKNLRPPISSWCKLGLEVADGYRVKAYIDDLQVLGYESDRFVSGPFHISSGEDLIEFDDVKAANRWSVHEEAAEGTPLYVESTNFLTKELTEHDPIEYENWARGRAIFARSEQDGYWYITSSDAIPGDVYYQSVPHGNRAGELKDGRYVFRFLKGSALGSASPERQEELFSLRARRDSRRWIIDDERYPEIDGKSTRSLHLSRSADHGNRPAVFLEKWIPIADAVAGFIHVSVGCDKCEPQPEHHEFRGRNMMAELFEEAATEWCWTEGRFRMAARWACRSKWNFMACGATGTPWMASKKRFWGDQSHEYFMSLRAVQPPDGGDENFSYDENEDRDMGFPTMKENRGWYNKHNLDFAFCTDGVNPLSGYAVIYAAEENSKNFLLRKGKVVAENSRALMPGYSQEDYGPIHWLWWNFRCARSGRQIVVKLNDDVLFEYTDEEPLEGGHVGFFTARNGFSVAKIGSMAERIDRAPFFMWVEEAPVECDWYPLIRDGVRIEKISPQEVKVSQRIGGGSLAVRHDVEKVDLEKSPVIAFPLVLSSDAAVNLFLSISGRPYVIQLNENPLSKTKALLTPEFEKGEMFRLPFRDFAGDRRYFLGKVTVAGEFRANLLALLKKSGVPPPYRLESLTLGNSSEEGFLTFGAEKNRRGASYRVGKVRHER